MLIGESGTGKELIARAINRNSPSQHKPDIALNCELPVELPSAEADSDLVIQVIDNLVDNAIRFAQKRVTIRAESALSESGEKEVRIIRARVPGASEALAGEIGRFMQGLRERQLSRMPGVAETLDWARALISLHRDGLDAETVRETLGCIVKDSADAAELDLPEIAALLSESAA